MAIDQGLVARNVNSPQVIPGGDTQEYAGPIQVSGVTVASAIPAGQTVNLGITAWLPVGPAAGFNALTPNPGNTLQGLSITVTFTWNASE
jgi:hypothetical protein